MYLFLHSSIQFVPDYYKAQDMFDKAANKCFLLFIYIPVRYKTQEMCGRVIFDNAFMLVYCPDK